MFYFEPYEGASAIDMYEKKWPIAAVYSGEKMVVGIVWDKTLENQVNTGDEILSFAGLNYANMSFCEQLLSDKNTGSDTADVVLKDIKTGAVKTVRIEKK